MKKQKVVVGLSGGKDSTAAIILLQQQGFEVNALTMLLGLPDEEEKMEKISRLAQTLQIPFFTFDARELFRTKVIDYFINAYAESLTPNPCVVCNKEIKFKLLMEHALANMDADYYATGHYAAKSSVNNSWFLREPQDVRKSQIYFLSMINPGALEKIIFPIAHQPIHHVREIVAGLPLAGHGESQDVCFLAGLNVHNFLQAHLPVRYFKPGPFYDVAGNIIGSHNGAVFYTIGQRRGIRYAGGCRLYVTDKDVQGNAITLGEEKHLNSSVIHVVKPNFWRPIAAGEVFSAKFRYMSAFHTVTVASVSPQSIVLNAEKPVKAIAPGQVAVLYQQDMIIAAGFIK